MGNERWENVVSRLLTLCVLAMALYILSGLWATALLGWTMTLAWGLPTPGSLIMILTVISIVGTGVAMRFCPARQRIWYAALILVGTSWVIRWTGTRPYTPEQVVPLTQGLSSLLLLVGTLVAIVYGGWWVTHRRRVHTRT